MDLGKLNDLIKKVQAISKHQKSNRIDPLLNESLEDCLLEIKSQYGSYLMDKLFDVYDDFFSDDEMKPIEQYLTADGVAVEGDELEELHSKLTIKPYPLRFEVTGTQHHHKHIIWQAA